MNKLVFDFQAKSLLSSQLHKCLEAAQLVGFKTPVVEFLPHVSEKALVTDVYSSSGLKSVSATFEMTEQMTESDIALYYEFEPSEPSCLTEKSNLISVAINDGDVLKDKVRRKDGVTSEFHSLNLVWSQEHSIRHYCWFVIALSLEFTIEDAVIIATAAVKEHQHVSRETWPLEEYAFPELSQKESVSIQSPFKLIPHNMGLYPVVDSVEWVENLLSKGVKTLQLRIKDSSCSDLESKIKQAIELGRKYEAQVFINDHWKLALQYHAYGVHLGQEDIECADLSAINKAGIRLGISTHSYYEILRAKQLKPSYIALGHIFPTTTKDMPSQPQGLNKLYLYQKLIGNDFPTVAIGGINLNNAEDVWRCGVSSLAVVRAITQADDIQLAIDSFYQIMATPRFRQAIA